MLNFTHKRTLNAFALATVLSMTSFSSANIVQAEPNPNFHVYICIGQSNMEGNAAIETVDKQNIDARFKMMAAVDFQSPVRKRGKWYKAVPPLCRQGTGLTPCDYFGRTMVANLPEDITVGVINIAIGGCKIEHLSKGFNPKDLANEADWFKAYMSAYDNVPYDRIIECAKKAQETGVIKGILLHQGCSNNGDSQWAMKVRKLYNNLIADLDLVPEETPLLVGQLLDKEQGGACWGMNTTIDRIQRYIPNAHTISSENCPGKDDHLHFTAEGYRILGTRYAEKMLSLMGIKDPVLVHTAPYTPVADAIIAPWAQMSSQSDAVYTLNGKRIATSFKNVQSTLPRGTYLVGGKKVLIR